MIRWLLRGTRVTRLRGPYDTISGRWIQYGRAYGPRPWNDANVTRYPSKAAMINDPNYLGGGWTDVARDMRGDRPASEWRRCWDQDLKALMGED